MSEDTDQVIALERKFWTHANDPAFFQETVADDGISVIEPMGFIEKPQAVQYAAQGQPFKDVKFKDLLVRELTPDCVILVYHGQGWGDGGEEPYRGSICSTYVKRDGRWQLALTAHQPWKP